MSLPEIAEPIVQELKSQNVPRQPAAAIILGSGLGSFSDHIGQSRAVPYHQIPGLPVTSVKGHDGQLIWGTIEGRPVVAFSGRFHHYEGYTFEQTALPVYIARGLGARKLIISNAAGAINTDFRVGDLMVIESVLRQNMRISPPGYTRHRYNHTPHVERVRQIAADLGMPIQRGTYLYAKGPNYETKAEIRAFRTMGADAVGMSTAPELFEAARLHLPSAAISLISNMAAGVTKQRLDHEEVKQAAASRKNDFARLVNRLIEEL